MNYPSTDNPSRKSFTLSELSESIKVQVERIYRRPYWIKAEINRLNHYPQSGHAYPELVEKRSGKIIAQMRGIIFRTHYDRIEEKFRERTGKNLKDGMEVLFLCRVRFEPKYGLSLVIEDIDPSYTLGEMARLRAEAIRRLQKEGIYDLNRSRYLPKLIKRLAVVSVETSKGWRDFSEVLLNSSYGGVVNKTLFNAKLQGDDAVKSIGEALAKIEIRQSEFDAVAIIRGGGGETGMDCYDNYDLARRVCTFPLPVMTGIGHSTNLTVVEMCSHKNLITPTALAGFIVEEFSDFERRIEMAARTIKRVGKHFLPLLQNRLAGLDEKLERVAKEKVDEAEKELIHLGRTMEKQIMQALKQQHLSLDYQLPARLSGSVKRFLEAESAGVESASESLRFGISRHLMEEKRRLEHLEEKCRILDPVNVLKRGFSITTLRGISLTSASQAKAGDEITTQLADGKLTSTVKTEKDGE